MKKKSKRQIGFKRFEDPESDNENINGDNTPDSSCNTFFGGPPKNLGTIIEQMYIPASNAELSDDMVSHIDLVESVNTMCDCGKGYVFDKMIELGFLSKTVEGQLFWLVNNR